MTDPVKAAMERAAAAATQVPAVQSTEIATAAPAPAAVALSMETMTQGSMSVDKWIKVKEDGLKIGDMAGLLDSISAVMDMTSGRGFILKYGVKNGNPAQYAYSTDLANAAGGGTWPAALQRIQALNPATPASPYRCVDLPFKLIDDVKVKDVVVGKADDTLGYTTSTTNWKNWEEFYKEVDKAGLMGKEVEVKLTAQPRTNKAGNAWGVLKIELVKEFIADAAAD